MRLTQPRFIALTLTAVILAGISSLCQMSYAQAQKQKPQKKPQESFTRPAPTRPQGPQIPSQNRYQEGKVFLERADSLYTNPDFGRDDRQILKGNVEFRQGDMYLYCDSAYYYPEQNSMDAFGNVRMTQGQTRGYADVVYYDGNAKLARMRTRGHGKVKLQDRNTTLTTDSLDYSLLQDLGWFNEGGTIDDGISRLSSTRGNYSPRTRIAEFEEAVVLTNKKDGYVLRNEKLTYDTRTHIASIDVPTEIVGRNDIIHTSRGTYNTATDNAVLESRSTIEHIDSAGNAIFLEGDSMTYDKASGISQAYASTGAGAQPMILTDTAHCAILIGNYGYYNNNTRTSIASGYPLLKEYSRGDTLFLRADTIRSDVHITYELPPETIMRLTAEFNDTTRRQETANVTPGSATPSLALGTDVSERDVNPTLHMIRVINPELTPLQAWLANADSSLYRPREYYVAKAYRHARFFRPDVQGVADTIRFDQRDSMLYLTRRPVIWSGNRQVAGNRIDVHMKDSTVDWALLPEFGIMSEHVEDEFYNQMSGRRLFAEFNGEELHRLEADGNVNVIFLPAENDSSYNKLVNAESSFMTIDLNEQHRLEKLKMWPDVSGTVTPIFMIKKNSLYLPGFQALQSIRPRRGWYPDGTMRWDDELGDVPDELEIYLNLPPLSSRASEE